MYLIAEIGFNHGGDIALARDMIRAAAESGADAVKFQTFKAGDILLPTSPHFQGLQKGELSPKDHLELADIARKSNVDFISTPFSAEAVDLLLKTGVSAYKVASMDCTNHPLLRHIAKTGKPVHLSTGMARPDEIAHALTVLKESGCKDISILHCVSKYPAQAKDLNLEIIPFMKQVFGVTVGYSDHFPGIEACFAALALGARIIETHFTLDKTLPDGDHSHSADPSDIKQLKEMATRFRTMKGSKEAVYEKPDKMFAKDYRRGVYTRTALEKGTRLSGKDLYCARPQADFTPNDLAYLEGKVLRNRLPAHSPVSRDSINN